MAVVADKSGNEVTFIFSGYPDAKQVYLAGDFNAWNPTKKRMSKYRDGTFRAKITLKPGAYQYKFVADGKWLTDPEAPEQVPDSFGGVNSLVRIG
jgi:1,4-alpha-glucan branching enzyme